MPCSRGKRGISPDEHGIYADALVTDTKPVRPAPPVATATCHDLNKAGASCPWGANSLAGSAMRQGLGRDPPLMQFGLATLQCSPLGSRIAWSKNSPKNGGAA